MKYLKVFVDFVQDMSELSDAERGRLFTLMLEYAATGAVPSFKGNERFLWGTAAKMIDAQRSNYDTMCDRNRSNATSRSESQRVAASGSESHEEQEQEQEQDKEQEHNRKRFAPPTVEEVRAYCKERKNSVNPEQFVDFYSAKGWRVGNQPMKDWKAAVRTWEQRDKGKRTDKRFNGQNFDQKIVSMEGLDLI